MSSAPNKPAGKPGLLNVLQGFESRSYFKFCNCLVGMVNHLNPGTNHKPS